VTPNQGFEDAMTDICRDTAVLRMFWDLWTREILQRPVSLVNFAIIPSIDNRIQIDNSS
jgi:hypothetical protein